MKWSRSSSPEGLYTAAPRSRSLCDGRRPGFDQEKAREQGVETVPRAKDSTLQVDLSFWTPSTFRATSPTFEVLFGDPGEPGPTGPTSAEPAVGLGWLYALHARSALGRQRLWQAVEMLDGLRTQTIALASARENLPAYQGRGVDRLPAELLSALARSRAPQVDLASIFSSFAATAKVYLSEAQESDPVRADHLRPVLQRLVASIQPR